MKMKKLAAILTAFILVFTVTACGKGNNEEQQTTSMTFAQQLEKGKELLEKTALSGEDLGIAKAGADSSQVKNAAPGETLSKEQIVEILNTQGLKALATQDAADWGMGESASQKQFLALYTIVNKGMSSILDKLGENAFNRYCKLSYTLAPELERYEGVVDLVNPMAVRAITDKTVLTTYKDADGTEKPFAVPVDSPF